MSQALLSQLMSDLGEALEAVRNAAPADWSEDDDTDPLAAAVQLVDSIHTDLMEVSKDQSHETRADALHRLQQRNHVL
jgi:hypothetical protein